MKALFFTLILACALHAEDREHKSVPEVSTDGMFVIGAIITGGVLISRGRKR